MRITTGKVVAGKIVVDGEPLEEGAVVTVLSRESDETFELSEQDEARILESLAEASRGETVPAHSLVRDTSSE